MPRATEPKPRITPALSPETMGSSERRRAGGENRLLEAMRQSGATERGKTQAKAQLAGAGVGAGTKLLVQRMQEKEADRRAAEKIRENEEDRKLSMSLQRVTEKGATDRKQMQIDHENAIRSGNLELLLEIEQKAQAQENFNKMVDYKNAKRDSKIGLKLMNRGIETEQDLAKAEVVYQQTTSDFKRNRGSIKNIIGEVAERVGTTDFGDTPLALGFRDISLGAQLFDDEAIKEQLPQVSAKLLTSAGQSKIEKMFASGELKGFDYAKGGAVIDGLITGIGEKITEITDGEAGLKEIKKIRGEVDWWGLPWKPFKEKEVKHLTEEGRRVKWLKSELSRLQNMKQVWRNVADSDEPMKDNKNLTVGKMLAKPKGVWLDVSPAKNFAELQELTNNNIRAQAELVNAPEYYDYTNFFSQEEIDAQENLLIKQMMIDQVNIYGQED